MNFTGPFILTSFLSVQNGQMTFDNPEKEALRHLSKALYIELELDKTTKRLEKQYKPKWIDKYGPFLGITYRIAHEKRISYTWRF